MKAYKVIRGLKSKTKKKLTLHSLKASEIGKPTFRRRIRKVRRILQTLAAAMEPAPSESNLTPAKRSWDMLSKSSSRLKGASL